MGGTPDPAALRSPLMDWYEASGRHDLPWRKTRDPYAVLVSEVMLQQTQAARVVSYYEAWMSRWPDAAALAAASPGDVIRAWAGLGYNRRALNLHRAATVVVERCAGAVPSEVADLLQLPGIGPYTAGAVACFAGGASVPFADTNIARTLARAMLGQASARTVDAAGILSTATALLPAEGGRDHNLALMDLGAIVCTARAPACLLCPLISVCAWRAKGCSAEQPASTKRGVPFNETARFARGRIVDALRKASRLRLEEIAERLPERHAARAEEHLVALLSEGMVTVDDGWWSLPD